MKRLQVKLRNYWRDFQCITGFHKRYIRNYNEQNAYCTWCEHEIDLEEFNRLRLNELRQK